VGHKAVVEVRCGSAVEDELVTQRATGRGRNPQLAELDPVELGNSDGKGEISKVQRHYIDHIRD
jgi:hypothetical protein